MSQIDTRTWPTSFRTGIALGDVVQLTKPRITVMVAVTAFIGYVMAARAELHVSMAVVLAEQWHLLLACLAGTSLSCMGASSFNQVIERDTDALMNRTRNRPLPAGRMTPATALTIALLLGIAGVTLLATVTTPLAAFFAAFTIGAYALIYTPLKRMSTMSTIVGAVPGALPPVIGGAAATGRVGIESVLLFSILFLWQLPHFLAIAWLYREDYARARMQVLPVVEPDGSSTFRQIIAGCMVLLPLGLLPTMLGVSGMTYFIGALLCGGAFLFSGILLAFRHTRGRARLVFLVSLVYLPLVYGLMLADQIWQ
jgi:protoheme IX farnesyltransferase